MHLIRLISQVNPHASILSSLSVRSHYNSLTLFGLGVGYLAYLKVRTVMYINIEVYEYVPPQIRHQLKVLAIFKYILNSSK